MFYSFSSASPSPSSISKHPNPFFSSSASISRATSLIRRTRLRTEAGSDGVDTTATTSSQENPPETPTSIGGGGGNQASISSVVPISDKDIKKVVQKTVATFAPRASTATKNPAVPGTALYTVFEVQGYASMFLGGALSFNLIFPSNEPDIWRLMGMWSIWMFTIPSLRARDCSKNEKEALNYLFLLIPLLNIAIPFLWKSFAVVWSADTVAFFAMYAWKLGWLQRSE
ncbi:protein RESISTANCE TO PHYTOPHTHORA 1, chloroplastic-like [Zingiber officinale]|uniref:protein RESISTANCE TO PHYTOPHTHORA 1, chloroplastic-like n=1 Tax=Zingiber officinale TaxID=94328 RepID=UPI001C4B63F2|nr:protein RESISTANCE TO PHYTOPHTHORA 1, chloroplastic-like [Zingiber officinale]